MSKIIKTVAVIAIAVAVVVYAGPIAGALSAAAKGVGIAVAAAGIQSALVGMGLTLALSGAMGLFRKTPNMSQSIADRLNTSVVPSAPRKIVFGTTSGGQDVRFFEGDIDLPSTKKDGYAQVIALASHRISAFKAFYAENDLIWSNGNWVTKRDGFASNNPLRFVLEGKSGNGFPVGSGRYWKNTATFTGCAYYSLLWRLDAEGPFPSGPPARLTAIIDGCPLYDPRRDSTRGGSGTHRLDNQATWAFNDGAVEIGRNPALALLTYLIGYRINGKLVWGMGIPADRIDFDNFRNYANICEEQVATQAGGTIQRYTCDAIYSTADNHETVIGGITASMGSCRLSDRGGQYGLIGGYDDTAGPKVAFDENDLVAAGGGASPYVWSPAPPSRERFNIVRGRFADPANLYQLTDWGDPIEIEPLADNVPRTLTLDLGAVSRAATCQRIAKQFLLREAKTPGMFTALFGPKAFAVQVGSVITLSLPSEGWNNKLFRVTEQAETHDLLFQMTLREEDPAIYAWDREEKPLPAIVRPQGYDPTTTIAPENLTLTTRSYEGANRYNVSEVDVRWTPETSGRVAGIQVQSRPAGETSWTPQTTLYDPKAGLFTFSSNAPGIQIEVQARFRMMTAVYSQWVNANIQTAPVIVSADWNNITDADGTRPEDNATVGAPAGTDVAGRPAEEVWTGIEQATGINEADRRAAQIAAQDALTAKTRAEAVSTIATEKAEAAAQAQAASDLARKDAQAARDAAKGSETASTTAASNADAARSAAQTFANSASTSAGVSTKALSDAQLSVAQSFPSDPVQGEYFTQLFSSKPGDTRALDTGTYVDAGLARRIIIGSGTIAARQWLTVDAGRTYKVTATVELHNTGSGKKSDTGLLCFDATGKYLGAVGVNIATNLAFNTGPRTGAFTGSTESIRAIYASTQYVRPFVNCDQDAGKLWSVALLRLEDVTSETNAAGQASAAANSASSAAASNTAAGQYATSASSSETNARTHSGSAQTYANSASTSAQTADQRAQTATTQAGLAAQSAGNASTSASQASSSATTASNQASSASNSASLAASLGGGSLTHNPSFAIWPGTLPTNYVSWESPAVTKTAGNLSPNSLNIYVAGGALGGVRQGGANATWTVKVDEWIVIEADILLVGGSLVGAGVLVRGAGTGDNTLAFATDRDTRDVVVGAGTAGTRYRFAKLVKVSSGSHTESQLYLMNHWATFGAISAANEIRWTRAGFRAASAAEIAAQRADTNANSALAKISTEETARVDADKALTARANTLDAQFAGTTGSAIQTRIVNEEAARADADKALGTRASALESKVGGHNSADIVARIASEETTRSNADSAIALRTTTIESRGSWGGINLLGNTDFDQSTAGWSLNAPAGYSGARDLSGDSWRPVPDHNIGIQQLSGTGVAGGSSYAEWFSDSISIQDGKTYEVMAWIAAHRCQIGLFAGRSPDGGQTQNYTGQYALTVGQGGIDLNGWTQVWFKFTATNAEKQAHLLFRKWPTLAGNTDSYVWMTRPYIGECDPAQTVPGRFVHGSGRAARAAISATLNEEIVTRTDQTGALGRRATSLEAKVGNVNSADTVARITAEENVRARQTDALATRTTGLEVEANNINARLSREETARADAVSSTVMQVDTLRSQVNSRANILPNGGFETGTQGWAAINSSLTTFDDNIWGRCAYVQPRATSGSTTAYVDSERINVFGNTQYVASVEVRDLRSSSDGTSYVELIALDANGIETNRGQSQQHRQTDFTASADNRNRYTASITTAGNAVKVLFRIVFSYNNVATRQLADIRRAKIEQGAAPATLYSNEASVVRNAGTLVDTNKRVSTAWLENTVQAGSGVAELSLRADGISNTSNIALKAGSIVLNNESNGQSIPALRVEGGNAVFSGRLQANGGVMSSPDGKARFDLNGARIVFNQGGYMQVVGSGFGSQGQFIDWFGPSYSDVSQCTESTAITYKKTNGDAYFGGRVLEGQLRNQKSTTNTGDNQVAVGPFATNGRARTYTASIYCERSGRRTSTYDDDGPFSANYVIEVLRNGAWEQVAGGGGISYSYSNMSGGDGPQFASPAEPGTFIQRGSGSLSWVDNRGGTDLQTVRVRLLGLSLPGVSGNAPEADKTDYYLRINTFEQ